MLGHRGAKFDLNGKIGGSEVICASKAKMNVSHGEILLTGNSHSRFKFLLAFLRLDDSVPS